MEAIIFSNFPRRLINETIEPKLAKYNIKLTRKYFGFSNFTIKQGEDVFIMNEMCSHSEVEKVLAVANKVKANIHYLSRKSSAWESQFKVSGIKVENDMEKEITPKGMGNLGDAVFYRSAVTDPKAILDAIGTGKLQGKTYDQIAIDVAKYWKSGKTNGANLKTWANTFAKRHPELLPESYKKFKAKNINDIIRNIHSRGGNKSVAQPVEMTLPEPVTVVESIPESTAQEIVPVVQEAVASSKGVTNEDLLAIADAEIAQLKSKLKDATEKVQPVSGNITNLKTNKELILRGIQTGLFTKDSAFEKLCEMIDRC